MLNDNGLARKNQISKKQKRKAKAKLNMELVDVTPLTPSQKRVFREYDDEDHLLLTGSTGTGKTFLSCFLAAKKIENDNCKILIVRSAVPSRDMGFMPGNEAEKLAYYESPYIKIFNDLYGRGDAYDNLKKSGLIEFQSSSYFRGDTLDNSIVIVDEFQNMTWQELSTIITRIGTNSYVFLSGDIKQNDLWRKKDGESGGALAIRILSNMEEVLSVDFTQEDIVRSGFVKNFIIECEKNDL